MFEKKQTELLFATPFSRFKVAGYDALNAALLAAGHKMRVRDEGVNKSNRGGWHSSGNIFDEEADCFKQLYKIALAATMDITKDVGAKADLSKMRVSLSGWMNINGRGAYNAPHTHPGHHWSGVYYVSQPAVEEGSSGMLEFLDPRSDLPNWRKLKANVFRPKRKFRPQAGEIVLFPSYLSHWVFPNDIAEERVSIAFNATFRSKPKSDA